MSVEWTRAIVRNVPLGALMVVLLGVVVYEAREVGRLKRENRLLLAEKDSAVERADVRATEGLAGTTARHPDCPARLRDGHAAIRHVAAGLDHLQRAHQIARRTQRHAVADGQIRPGATAVVLGR